MNTETGISISVIILMVSSFVDAENFVVLLSFFLSKAFHYSPLTVILNAPSMP
jgi:hypothetical protein